jgi:polysaccharide deacetylase family protein (PEP-CTERM system associated)
VISNALTIDVEDYFMVSAFEDVVRRGAWDQYESHIERNTRRLLETLDGSTPKSLRKNMSRVGVEQTSTAGVQYGGTSRGHAPKATFFVVGWIAERFPNLIREISGQGHEVACHSYDHQVIFNRTPNQFREDIRRSKKTLEDIIGEAVIGYRAPSYSITRKSLWAFEILIEEGFRYDSSIFPIHHDVYGLFDAPRFPFVVYVNGNGGLEYSMVDFDLGKRQRMQLMSQEGERQHAVNGYQMSAVGRQPSILEVPVSTIRRLGVNIPISGGGYFRLFPYSLIKKALKSINQEEGQPFVFYIHPWEIDPGQPKINNVSRKSRLRHYVNLDKTEARFRVLLKDFVFLSIRDLFTAGGCSVAAKRGSM